MGDKTYKPSFFMVQKGSCMVHERKVFFQLSPRLHYKVLLEALLSASTLAFCDNRILPFATELLHLL